MSEFYEYSQNNSGGFHKKPAITVIVEAESEQQAEAIAEKHRVYFFDEWDDCPDCCGSRWSLGGVWKQVPEPNKYDLFWAEQSGLPAQLIIRREK